ncbi:MAG: SLBB domain-containing protein [Cyclobacteriaceae bacterium]
MDFEDLDISDLDNDEIGGKIFGAEVFSNSALNFTPSVNIPTPENYILGAGDELIIDIWGASEKTYQLIIGPEGVVKIPSLGPVFLSGLSIEEASARLLKRLTKIYAGLNDSSYGNQNTYGQVTLGRIRSIKVNVIGEVKNPGTYTISSMSTVLHALFRAGGPARDGTFRDIQVFREGKLISTFDVYDFLLKGVIKSNVSLRDQDVIRVSYYGKRVKIIGEIKNPAIYEVKNGESLQTIMNYAGGVTEETYTKLVTIRRTTENARKILTIKDEEFEKFELRSGDEIKLSRIADIYENLVTIKGSVYRPGEYEFTEGLKLSDLIVKAEGVTADAFRERGQVTRSNSDLTLRNIQFNIDSVLSGRSDFQLQTNDVVNISSIFDLQSERRIRVQGEVRNPQSFIFQDDLTVEDVILKAGGFKETAAKSFVEVARIVTDKSDIDRSLTSELFTFPISEELLIGAGASSFLLKPFDLVTIRRSPIYSSLSTVEVEGEVLYPGKYVINKRDERISDVIKRSGGFTNEAYPTGGTLIRRTEYFDDAEAAKVKRLRIQGLNELEENTDDLQISQSEAIAIELKEIISNPGGKYDLFVQDGDIISVPKELQTVRVRGEIHFSSNISFDEQRSFKDYVSSAGGFTSNAKAGKSYIVYPNGSAERTKQFLWIKKYPNVEPGSEIIIPARPTKEGVTPERLIGLTSSVLTMLLIVDRLSR